MDNVYIEQTPNSYEGYPTITIKVTGKEYEQHKRWFDALKQRLECELQNYFNVIHESETGNGTA